MKKETTDDRKKIIFLACNIIHDNIIDDFTLNPFKDKFKYYKIKDSVYFIYTFENKQIIRYTYTGLNEANVEFTHCNEDFDVHITGDIVIKHFRLMEHILLNNKERHQELTVIKTTANTNTSSNNTYKDKYNNIVRQIKLKVSEINILNKNDSKRTSLLNELNSYKSVADKLKKLI